MKKSISMFLSLGLILVATGCSFSFSIGENDDEANDTASVEDQAEVLFFDTANFGYTINYPLDWQKQEDTNAFTVVFANGKASVAIQNLASKEMGGVYETVNDVVEEFKSQLNEATNTKITEEQEITYEMEDGEILTGAQFVAEYTIPADNATYKQLQIVLPRSGGQVFHAWSYTSLVENYEAYAETAKQILASWKILK